MDFPHLKDTEFPGVSNIDVYRYRNTFDYKRWEANAKIKVLNVPWEIDGTNAVYFESEEERNAWFSAQDGESLNLTSALQLMPNDTVPLPVPFDVLQTYNYVMVEFPVFTSEGDMIGYERANGVRTWFYFIDSVERKAANTTLAHVKLDTWTTFINRIDVSYMMLERGHAPMAATSVDAYLSNPLDNCELLTAPDVNFGAAQRLGGAKSYVINDDDLYIVFVATADITVDWGSYANGNYHVPGYTGASNSGAPDSVYIEAIAADDYSRFFESARGACPAFFQTIQGLFLIPGKLLNFSTKTALWGVDVYYIAPTSNVRHSFGKLDASMFAYDERYANIAKLYTSPYAQVVLSTESGTIATVDVQNIGTEIALNVALNLSWPSVSITGIVEGVGASGASSLAFKNLFDRSIRVSGVWYDLLAEWNVPVWAVVQDEATRYDYATLYDRIQASNDYNTAYSNAANNASNITANNAIATSAASTITARTNQANIEGEQRAGRKIFADQASDNAASSAAYNAELAGLAVSVANNDATAATTAATTVLNTVSGVVGSLASGSVGGAVGSLVGGVSAGASAYTSWANTSAALAVSQSNSTAIYNSTITTTSAKATHASDYAADSTSISNSAASDNTATQNNAATSTASNNAGLITTNAGNDRSNAQARVNNQVKQAGLGQPNIFGTYANTENSTTRPMAFFLNVVTQDKGSIAQAGSQMLRYGYFLNQAWEVKSFNVMKNFSYWKAQDVWLTGGSGLVEGAQEEIKSMLINGVTIWSDPDKIGAVSIYDN